MDPINFYEKDSFSNNVSTTVENMGKNVHIEKSSIADKIHFVIERYFFLFLVSLYCCVDKYYICLQIFNSVECKPQSDCHTVQNKINIFYIFTLNSKLYLLSLNSIACSFAFAHKLLQILLLLEKKKYLPPSSSSFERSDAFCLLHI